MQDALSLRAQLTKLCQRFGLALDKNFVVFEDDSMVNPQLPSPRAMRFHVQCMHSHVISALLRAALLHMCAYSSACFLKHPGHKFNTLCASLLNG